MSIDNRINIAIEISPLLTASGIGGDKSGVYRYMWGIISAIKNRKDDYGNVVLFTFNRNLQENQANPDFIDFCRRGSFIFLNDYREPQTDNPELNNRVRSLYRKMGIVRPFLKLIKSILKIDHIYWRIREKELEKKYLEYLTSSFCSNKVRVIFHSETGFKYIEGYKNIITVYDLTTVLFPRLHRPDTVDLHSRKFDFINDYCDGILCISNSTKQDLLSYYPSLANKKIVTIYPGINDQDTDLTLNNQTLFDDISALIKKGGQILEKKKYLLYYGTFEPRKNLIYLLQSFLSLRDEGKIPQEFKLVFIGGRGWGNIKDIINNYLAENYPISKNNPVIVLDFLGDKYLHSFIRNAYAIVYPSLYEGFGLPVLESMSLGTPVLCSNNSSMPEVGGNSVLYLEAESYNDIKMKMELLISDKQLAQKLSDSGLIQSKNFTWAKTTSNLATFLRQFS